MLGALKRKGPRRFPGQSRGDGLDRGGLAKATARRANASICCVFSSDRDSRTRARSAVSVALPSMQPPPVPRDTATLSRRPHVCRSSRPLPKSHDCHPMQALPAACIHAVDAAFICRKRKAAASRAGWLLLVARCFLFGCVLFEMLCLLAIRRPCAGRPGCVAMACAAIDSCPCAAQHCRRFQQDMAAIAASAVHVIVLCDRSKRAARRGRLSASIRRRSCRPRHYSPKSARPIWAVSRCSRLAASL